jgi:enolase
MMNILNGGAHSRNNIDIQEFMIVPHGAASFSDAVRMGAEVYSSLKRLLESKKLYTAVGDEGGFAPILESDKDALSLMCDAIERAGYKAGDEISLALDVASSEWYEGGAYRLPKRGITMTADELAAYVMELVDSFPIISVEDGMAEDDIAGWQTLTKSLKAKGTFLVGDDLFVTNTDRIKMGIEKRIANAVLIKPNQIGTLTETAEAISLADESGYETVMSHRSGETEDTIIADLSVGFGTRFIKTGAPARSERVAKYNRLMTIEREIFSSEYGF